MIPCVYALLTHKTKETYRNMIADLKDGAAKLKLKLNPVFVMIDFESAVIDAYKMHFQGIEINLDFKTT